MGRIPRFLCMLFLPQVIILCGAAAKAGKHGILSFPGFASAGIVLLYAYLLVRIHLFPVRRVPSCTRRIKILLGGKIILSCSLWGFLMQGIFYILLFTGHLSPLDRLFAGSPLLYTINVIHSISFKRTSPHSFYLLPPWYCKEAPYRAEPMDSFYQPLPDALSWEKGCRRM